LKALTKRPPTIPVANRGKARKATISSLDTTLLYRDRSKMLSVYHVDTRYKDRCLRDQKRGVRGGTLEIVDSNLTKGNPGVVVDGEVPREGTQWDSPKGLILSNEGSSVTMVVQVDNGRRLIGVALSADNNDVYKLEASMDGKVFTSARSAGIAKGVGMRKRFVFDKAFFGVKYIRITAESGDGKYSVGEVALCTEPLRK
jgi:hypothetical protein